ncbi:MAG TPA: hypothetical protein VHB21_18420 [Minicystis sp.]|nr:hypothetical protein [Minicystis sp.]
MQGTNKSSGQATGASDLEFDLVSEMHALLKGNEALEHYIEDAKGAGDQDAERCFRAICDQNKENVQKLRGLLADRLKKAA